MTTSSEKESIFMQFSIVGKTFDYPDTLYALEMIGNYSISPATHLSFPTVPHLLYSISFNWFYDLKCMGYPTNYQYWKNGETVGKLRCLAGDIEQFPIILSEYRVSGQSKVFPTMENCMKIDSFSLKLLSVKILKNSLFNIQLLFTIIRGFQFTN